MQLGQRNILSKDIYKVYVVKKLQLIPSLTLQIKYMTNKG